MKAAIDAGHGSQTAGKRTPDGYREHFANVKVSYYEEKYLQAHGIETFRSGWNDADAADDPDTALAKRQQLIKNAKCDLVTSNHQNAYGSGDSFNKANGCEVLLHNKKSKQGDSLRLAKCVHDELIKGTPQTDRGIKKQSLAICNCPAMGVKAAILSECAFMTNKQEADLMKTEAFCREQGEDIARGVLKYLDVPDDPDKTGQIKYSTGYELVFDPAYYYDKYPDLQEKIGHDGKKLLEHFLVYGIREGRQAKADFNVLAYKNLYKDLQEVFKDDLEGYMIHYITYGYKEGRAAV